MACCTPGLSNNAGIGIQPRLIIACGLQKTALVLVKFDDIETALAGHSVPHTRRMDQLRCHIFSNLILISGTDSGAEPAS